LMTNVNVEERIALATLEIKRSVDVITITCPNVQHFKSECADLASATLTAILALTAANVTDKQGLKQEKLQEYAIALERFQVIISYYLSVKGIAFINSHWR
jgi:hypothetical protein